MPMFAADHHHLYVIILLIQRCMLVMHKFVLRHFIIFIQLERFEQYFMI